MSLSARRAWIEICGTVSDVSGHSVALRKESVDRNPSAIKLLAKQEESLSARRAWIEIVQQTSHRKTVQSLSARRAWIEMPTALP